jgi:hypothetical protein
MAFGLWLGRFFGKEIGKGLGSYHRSDKIESHLAVGNIMCLNHVVL